MPRSPRARPASASAAPISPMASPLADRTTKRRCGKGREPISRSSPPITTCFRPTSPMRASPISSRRRRARSAAQPRSPAAFRRCATASPRARKGWSSPFSRATSSRCRRRSPFPTTCSTRRSISASATRLCRASSSARCRSAICRRCSCPRDPCPQASATPRSRKSASSTPRARRAAPTCWRRKPRPITRPARAPSTARPTPTRC